MHAQLEDLYSLKLPLGRNLAGAVWQAETLKGGKPAAVAVLDLEDLSDPDLRKRAATRFRRDMGLLRKVNHPHVVRVLDVGRTRSGRPFAAMEHVDGDNLNDWLDATHSGADRVRVASALLSGLEAAHRGGVAHGDLEPGNILMTNDGMPKLIGFGLNRTLARQSHPEWREESGLAKSIAFRAPEEATGKGGHSADLYATGILLHLICSGELPAYEGSTLRENAPRLPAGLVAVIERALVKDPLERHPNIASMRRAWLEAAKVACDAIETATTGFRAESERPMRPLSAPPAVGVAFALDDSDEEDEEDEELDMGRPSLMPVGVALAEDDGDGSADDLASLPPEQVNALASAPPPIATRRINERFSDPPPDPGMRISLSDALDGGDPPPDPEMRLSLSDVLEAEQPVSKPASRPSPRRPKPSPKPSPAAAPVQAAPAARDEGGGSKMWIGLGLVVVVGGFIWFSQRSDGHDPVGTEPTQTTRSGSEPDNTETQPENPLPETPPEVAPEPVGETPEVEPETEPEVEAEPIALRLHGLPAGAVASVDGENVTIEADSIPFPADGEEHTIRVSAEGYETWERSLATATALDLLVMAEALTPPPSMEAAPVAMQALMRPAQTMTTAMTPVMRPTIRATMTTMTTMRPGLARDPGF